MENIRVLLADDHTLFRKGLASLLEKEPGFEVVAEAEDGAEAIRKAQAVKPDLVLMDIHMPGVNGLEATAPDYHHLTRNTRGHLNGLRRR